MRHMLTQAMGKGEVVIDAQHMRLEDGDRLMLSSDGLTDGVSDEQIHEMLSRGTAYAAGELMHAALEAGGRDNVTVIVADAKVAQGLNAGQAHLRQQLVEHADHLADLAGDAVRLQVDPPGFAHE